MIVFTMDDTVPRFSNPAPAQVLPFTRQAHYGLASRKLANGFGAVG